MAQPLPPAQQSLGIFQNYIARQSESLVLKERVLSLSGDSFSIKTLDGRDILQVKGEALSLSKRKIVMDMQGNPMFTIRKHHFSFPSTYYAEDPQGNKFFEVEGKFSCEYPVPPPPPPPLFCLVQALFSPNEFYSFEGRTGTEADVGLCVNIVGSSKAIGRFVNSFTNQQEELMMKGNFFDTCADITNSKTAQPVARIDRKLLNARELFAGQQTYAVTVAEGVDMALIVAMCICLDERRNDH
jgi:uncharacterized protein YxjI